MPNTDQVLNAALTAASDIYRAATVDQWEHYVGSIQHAILDYKNTKENVLEAREILRETIEAAGKQYDRDVLKQRREYNRAAKQAVYDAHYSGA